MCICSIYSNIIYIYVYDQEHAAAEEQQKKRQRKEESKEAAPAGSKPLASQSMQPFGGAHSG